MHRTKRVGLLVAGPVIALAIAVGGIGAARAQDGPLDGTFAVAAGECSGAPAGSFFRMILPTGTTSGPFVTNADSPCADQTYTPLRPGTDGGLISGAHQPAPSPVFDSGGNGRADRIVQPAGFFGVRFAASTEPTDIQTGTATSAPTLSVDGSGHLSGNLAAFGATWNDQAFNQGSPKPNGSRSGLTAGPTGTLDAATGAFTLTWTSTIVGGPFDSFTGQWILSGTFHEAGSSGAVAAAAPAAPAASAGGPAPTIAAAVPGAALPEVATPDGATPATPSPAATPASSSAATAAASTGRASEDGDAGPPLWLVVLTLVIGLAATGVLLRRPSDPAPA